MTRILWLSIVLLCVGSATTYTQDSAITEQAPIPLRQTASNEVLFAPDTSFALPVVCGDDGNIYTRMMFEVVSISSDGKQKITYAMNKIDDVSNPRHALSTFVSQGMVFLLVRGMTFKGNSRTLIHPDGTRETVPGIEDQGFFIARFRRDGTYVGAIRLDVPMIPLQIGVFPSGEFLIGGLSKDRARPVLAMARADGAFLKFLELENDMQLQTEESAGEKNPLALPKWGKPSERGLGGFETNVQISTIVPDRDKLLLVRRMSGVPIFSVTPGGEVRNVKIDIPAGHSVSTLKPTAASWIVLYTRRASEERGVDFFMQSFDRETGKALESFAHPRKAGFGLGCTDGTDFTFLLNEGGRLNVGRFTAERH